MTSIHSAFGRWSAGTAHLSAKSAPLRSLALALVLCGLACSEARAQRAVGGGARIIVPGLSNSSLRADMPPACRHGCFSWERGHGFNHRLRGGFGGIIVVEREVPPFDYAQDERAKQEAPPPPAPPPAPSPEGEGKREPYVIGATYASLPGGCMKLIEAGAAFYYCGDGEWYRQVGAGRSVRYKAVARKL